MKRVQGNPDVALLECTNPVRKKWRVRWDMSTDDTGTTSYMEEEFNHKPSEEEIKSITIRKNPLSVASRCPMAAFVI